MSKICENCGQELPDNTAVCSLCGEYLPLIDPYSAARLLCLPDFPERYEVIEYLYSSMQSDTFVIRSRENGEYLLAKLYLKQPGADGADSADGKEKSILAELDHPAIPKLVDIIEMEDSSCIIREYAQGASLDRVSYQLDETDVVGIGIQLCDILTYLHSRKPPVIHRDIKPQNVILDDSGKVHLIDFGISRRFADDALRDTAHVGTEGFMSPEQYGFMQTDCRADIFSLGILLCWLMTGKRTTDALNEVANNKFGRIIRKCAAFAPESRYSTAKAVKKALLQIHI